MKLAGDRAGQVTNLSPARVQPTLAKDRQQHLYFFLERLELAICFGLQFADQH